MSTHSSSSYAYAGKDLHVSVISCNILKKDGGRKETNPSSICIEYGSSKFEYKEFGDKLSISLIKGIEELILSIWDKDDSVGDELIATTKIELHEVLYEGYDRRSWTIFDGSNKAAGDVELILSFSSTESIPPVSANTQLPSSNVDVDVPTELQSVRRLSRSYPRKGATGNFSEDSSSRAAGAALPMFGSWETGSELGYTAYFESVRTSPVYSRLGDKKQISAFSKQTGRRNAMQYPEAQRPKSVSAKRTDNLMSSSSTADSSSSGYSSSKSAFPRLGKWNSLSDVGVNFSNYTRIFSKAGAARENLSRLAEPVNAVPDLETAEYEVVFSFAEDHQELIQSVKSKLVINGISVFRNDLKVHDSANKIAEDFSRATDRCKICIPIISKQYLWSDRCLRELAYIWEARQKSSFMQILPVFYDMEPYKVNIWYRNYSPLYEVTNKTFTSLQWQETLRGVSEIQGWEMKDKNFNKYIDLIVNWILNKLKLKHQNTGFLIAEDQIKEVKKLLHIDSGSVLFVGIHGVSGIGKTALAKAIFKELADQFEGCSFLHNIQETAEQWGLKYLQDKLLRDIANKNINHEEFAEKKDGWLNKKVLIVLDDVHQREQISSLVGKTSCFGSGSRIIVTTQDISVLAVEHDTVDSILKWPSEVRSFEMRGLIEPHTRSLNLALQLFCRHAFGRDSPPDDHKNLSDGLVKSIGGLPLVLEIIASFLNRQPKSVWDSTLERLRQVPPLEIKEKLLISYESLEYETKQIFLDIACFFCNKDKTFPIYMWDACTLFPMQGLEVLFTMCLVKVGDDNILRMHDRVKEFGREMARIESFNKGLAQCSRLWVDEVSLDILTGKEEKMVGVEALSLGYDDSLLDLTFTNDSFERSPLRFLEMQGVHLAGNFKDRLPNLRWLQWHSCPEHCEATNLELDELVILDLSRSQLRYNWSGWSQLQRSTQLKVLNLTNCKSLSRSPDFSSHRVLERLILEGCTSLAEVDESIGSLSQLKYLNLNGCTSLKALPRSICNLTSLLRLEMDRASIDELPSNIEKLVKLNTLVLSSCIRIKELPWSLGYLTLLVHLDLRRIRDYVLPKSIRNMKMLKVLKIEYSWIRLCQYIGMLESLEELHARHCKNLSEVPNEIVGLSNLRIMDLSFSKIRSLPRKINQLSLLQTLRLESCDELQELPELPMSLVRLTITTNIQPDFLNWRRRITTWFSGTSTKKIQRWIGKLSKLETLELCIPNITKLELHAMSQLRSLSLSCHDFELFPKFPKSLSRLFLVNLKEKTQLSTLDNLEKLTFLEFYECSVTNGLERLGVGQIESLEHFSATRCNFSRLNGANLPKRLRLLSLSECEVLHELDLTGLINLIHLDVTSCSKLKEIRGLGELLCLEDLSICSCNLLETLGDLSKLEKLEGVRLNQCEKLKEVEGLDRIKSLKNLHICGCKSLENFHDKIGAKKQKHRLRIKA